MFTRVVIVQDDFDDLALFEDERVCGFAVDGCVRGCDVGGKSGEQGGDFGGDVGDVVEEGVVGAVAEVFHRDRDFDGVGRVFKEGHFVRGREGEVVEWIECVHRCRVGVGVGGIVD